MAWEQREPYLSAQLPWKTSAQAASKLNSQTLQVDSVHLSKLLVPLKILMLILGASLISDNLLSQSLSHQILYTDPASAMVVELYR